MESFAKLLILVTVLSKIDGKIAVIEPEKPSFIVFAVHQIVSEKYAKSCRGINLVAYAPERFDKVVQDLIKLSRQPFWFYKLPIRKSAIRHNYVAEFRKKFVIIFAQSLGHLLKVSRNLTNYVNNKHCLIYFLKFNEKDESELMKHFELRNKRYNYYFLIDERKVLTLKTFVYFTSKECRVPQLTTLNVFTKNMSQWQSNIFRIDKFANLNGCELTCNILKQPPGVYFDETNHVFDGFNYQIFQVFAWKFNYSLKLIVPKVIKRRQQLDENLDFSLLMVSTAYEIYRSKELQFTQPHFLISKLVIIPPGFVHFYFYFTTLKIIFKKSQGELYTDLEKLFLPFEFEVWMWILASFVVAYAVVFIINQFSRTVQNFVYGRNVRTPSINILIVFFGKVCRKERKKWNNF